MRADTYYGDRVRRYDSEREHTLRWAREQGAVAEYVTSGPVLDCPLGTGRYVGIYRDRGLPVIGIDISADMLAEARRKYPDLDARQGSVFDLPFEDDAFEVAVCTRLLDWLPPEQVARAMAELRRVARSLVVSIRHGREGERVNWTHALSRFYAQCQGLYIAGRSLTEETQDGIEEIFHLRPAVWGDVLEQFRFHGPTPEHEAGRLAAEWFGDDIDLPAASLRAEYWTGEELGAVVEAMGQRDSRYLTQMPPRYEGAAVTLLCHGGEIAILDGRRRANLWARTAAGERHPVLLLEA